MHLFSLKEAGPNKTLEKVKKRKLAFLLVKERQNTEPSQKRIG